ncbi:MAG TPA: septation protein IspZ [Phenylobacterium sp.]|uniref:inner membrane-spanning protein YciB n=1 Tax=Phenylobacterium sp. TaxID=1871053 RepID=UPI002BECC534|nr:septation protein IspZ [Phenylobacterium sp.]HSV02565.1 septation protein IspZ [Phenylobacterium sp.]
MSGLLSAMRPLAWDFLATIVFAILTALHVDVRTAAAFSWGAGLAQVLAMKLMRRPIPHLQWAGLGLALVFGAASMITRDPRFVMVKPTLIYAAVGAVMLKRGWLLRYLPARVSGHGEDLMIGWGYAWAAMMFVSGLANLVVAMWFTRLWPAYLAVAPAASKLGLFAVQYVSMRRVIRRRIRAAEAPSLPAAQAA